MDYLQGGAHAILPARWAKPSAELLLRGKRITVDKRRPQRQQHKVAAVQRHGAAGGRTGEAVSPHPVGPAD